MKRKHALAVITTVMAAIVLIVTALFFIIRGDFVMGMYYEITDDIEYPPSKVLIMPGILYYDSLGEKGFALYKVQKSLWQDGVRELKILKGRPPVESYLLHRESVGGRDIWILSDTLFEYDGRGLVIFSEYCRKADRKYIPEGYESELYHELNDREAVPTYIVDSVPGFTDVDFAGIMGKDVTVVFGTQELTWPVTASGEFLGEPASGDISCGEDELTVTKITLRDFSCTAEELIGRCKEAYGEEVPSENLSLMNCRTFETDSIVINIYYFEQEDTPAVELTLKGTENE